MKLKAKVTINTGLYMDIRPEIELDVPDDLKNEQLVEWLHTKYHGLLSKKEKRDNPETCKSCGGTASIGNAGEPLVGGLHPRCRVEEEVYKINNLK